MARLGCILAMTQEENESMPKHKQSPGEMPESSFLRRGEYSERGPSVHTEDQDALVKEILRAQAEEAFRAKVGRNEPCPCGSGKKYKRCCLERHRRLLSTVNPKETSFRIRLKEEESRCEERVKEGYELLGRREFERARSWGEKWSRSFPHDDRFKDIMVTACIHLGEFGQALEIAQRGYREATEEKAHFLTNGRHSWEEPDDPRVGHAYAPEAWLERLWVARKAVAYAEAYPEEPDLQLAQLVKELQMAEDADRYPQGQEQGLKVRREELSHVLEELKAAGPRALPYILPLCPGYGWSGLLVPELLVHWADHDSIRALVDLAMFRYPYLSESCLKGLEGLGEKSLPYLQEAFREDQEMDPLKTGLLSVAGEMGTPMAMEWLVGMLEHPLTSIVNWTAGVLGRKGYKPALPAIKKAMERVGPQPYIIWAIEELEKDRRI